MATFSGGGWDEALARSRARMDSVRQDWDARSKRGDAGLDLSSARKYYSAAGSRMDNLGGLSAMPAEVTSDSGLAGMLQAPMSNAAMAGAAASNALQQIGQVEAAREMAAAEREAAQQRSQGGIFGSILQTVGTIGGALIACDERVKSDIEPLSDAPRLDALAQLAYTVQELREHAG